MQKLMDFKISSKANPPPISNKKTPVAPPSTNKRVEQNPLKIDSKSKQIEQNEVLYNNSNKFLSKSIAEAPSTHYSSNTHYSNQQGQYHNPSSGMLSSGGSESVRVALRVRPMNRTELQRGDESCVQIINQKSIQLYQKGNIKHFQYNCVMNQRTTQPDELLESALDGYSATIFAYGQTGSGKTYTMAGVEQKLGREVYISDQSQGIIPRGLRYLWQSMAQRQQQFYVKASFTEIYNEQLRDLLNPASGILHCRWNVHNGFFVEDLMIVQCSNVDDMVAVLHEGMKNRKSGSHALNPDSSRSHSILTIYLISEIPSQEGGDPIKRYGKLSFVDLAGSERLQESKSQGEMAQETGQINQSLFTLGQVIQALSDQQNQPPYIPYRDSQLTMLLMDSLGGTAKALMIACVSPSHLYFDETLSTMNYAARTMNITNKPVIQMDQKDQVIFNLQREIDLLKMENQYLREQLQRVSNGLPIDIPDFITGGKGKQLPPLNNSTPQTTNSRPVSEPEPQVEVPINQIVGQYQFEMNRLRLENDELRGAREVAEKNYHLVMNDNNAIQIKLENLEQVFIGNPMVKGDTSKNKMTEEYMASAILLENTELKQKQRDLEQKNMELAHIIKTNINNVAPIKTGSNPEDINQIMELKHQNSQLATRVDFLQQRERDLLENLMKLQQISGKQAN